MGESSVPLVPIKRRKDGSMKLFLFFIIILILFGGFSILLPHSVLPDLPRQHQSSTPPVTIIRDTAIPPASDKKLAGLSCENYGGPSKEVAHEMVYWEDIESDSQFVSPFYQQDSYLTFEADAGGWNNIRMAMETVLALAFAMGRTLVLPPEKEMYLLKKTTGKHGKQKTTFSFNHFFHMDAIHNEHVGLNIITMKEFLESVAMKGKLVDSSGSPMYPPDGITDWDGRKDIDRLNEYLRKAGLMAQWKPEQCIGAFPASKDPKDLELLQEMERTILADKPKWETFKGHPVPLDAPPLERLKENWAERSGLCIYNATMQEAKVVHFAVDHSLHLRLLVHFYAFVFFQNWKIDLWMKRFIRDHVRYADEIQCAAARVVAAVRQRSKEDGMFDAFHVRRGDFQYKATRVEASVLLEMAQRKIPKGSLVYMATDERNKAFFDPLKEHYDLVFLDDFHDEALIGVNTNYYGMIDQLVATRSRTFFGCWFSTYVNFDWSSFSVSHNVCSFTGYINRLRGCKYSHPTPSQPTQSTCHTDHADEEEQPGYKDGILNSWYYVLPDRFDHMQEYYPVKKSFFAREFPTSWRLIDTTLETSS